MQTRIWDTEQLLTRNFWLKIDPDGLEPCEVCRPTTLAHKGPEVPFADITTDFPEPRFWITLNNQRTSRAPFHDALVSHSGRLIRTLCLSR